MVYSGPIVEVDVVALLLHDGRDPLASENEQTPAGEMDALLMHTLKVRAVPLTTVSKLTCLAVLGCEATCLPYTGMMRLSFCVLVFR